jgi:Glycosyl transferases group 1
MRVAQLTLRDASEYEKKCQRVDRVALAAEHEIVENERDADIVHVYGSGVRRPRRRWFEIAAARPPHSTTPLKDAQDTFIPEAVEEQYFAHDAIDGAGVGVFVRRSVKPLIEQTQHRVHRTRDDIAWHFFDRVPAPDDIAQVAVWLDPAVADDDFDGFVAEALAMGRIVVASRTPLNVQRLEKGRSGFLVPPDANEMTHAILTALYKPEVGRPRADAARQTVSKFRPRQRLRALTALYERLRT